MAGCIIYPIPIIRRELRLSGILFRSRVKRDCVIGSYAWYIEEEGLKILVDTGSSAEYIRDVKGYSCEEIQNLELGLEKLGLGCDDIDLVIFTHLHHDHTAQAHRLSKAKFIAQRDEIEFALNPHPFFANGYPRKFIDGLNFDPVYGDIQVTKNVSVIRTPGHTVGGQSVAVKTDKGLAIISGMCTIQENFEPGLVGSKLSVIPPTPHVNVIQVCDNMEKIKRLADILIPIHESKYLNIDSIPAQ